MAAGQAINTLGRAQSRRSVGLPICTGIRPPRPAHTRAPASTPRRTWGACYRGGQWDSQSVTSQKQYYVRAPLFTMFLFLSPLAETHSSMSKHSMKLRKRTPYFQNRTPETDPSSGK